jgi:hypothetical protein
LNLNEHSSHFIANYLWDVIASAKKSQEWTYVLFDTDMTTYDNR